MANGIHKLSDISVKAATKPGRLGDGGGLHLRISPSGSKSWAFMWTAKGKRTEMGLGSYPALSLKAARELAAKHRTTVAEGGNPKKVREIEAVPTFEEAVAQYLNAMDGQWSNEKHRYQWGQTLGPSYCGPILKQPVSEIDLSDVLAVLKTVWTEKPETASRLRGRIERILNFAKVKGWRSGENPAMWRGNLENVLPKKRKLVRGHQPALPFPEVPAFMLQLREREGMAARALEMAILTCLRTGEVLGARWDEFDLDAAVWTVPAPRMKHRREHRVPLVDASLELLTNLKRDAACEFVFPGQRFDAPLSNMAMLMLLRRMGRDDLTVHGFRSSFRDWAGDETTFPREIAEMCLAHLIGNSVEQSYRRSDALEKRRKLLAAWGDYCTGAHTDNVVALHG